MSVEALDGSVAPQEQALLTSGRHGSVIATEAQGGAPALDPQVQVQSPGSGTTGAHEEEAADPVPEHAREQGRDTDGRFTEERITVVKPGGEVQVLRPQPHGGALLTGGKVGGGKYADEVRRFSREQVLDMLPVLIQKAKDDKLRNRDHIKLAELLARIGVPQQSESLDLEEGRRRLQLVVGSMLDSALAYGVPKDVVQGWYRRAVAEMEAE